MTGARAGFLRLFIFSWQTDPRRSSLALLLMVLQSTGGPLSGLALGGAVDAVVAGDTGRALAMGGLLTAGVIASLTAGHFAHIYYFELGDRMRLRLLQRLFELTNGSVGIEHHERADCADKIHVLRIALGGTGASIVASLLGVLGLAVGMGTTGVLLSRCNPWLLLLPLAALPPLLMGRRAESVLATSRDRAAGPARRARHFLQLATEPASSKEVRVCNLEREVRARQSTAWSDATRLMWRGELHALALRAGGHVLFALAYAGSTALIVWDAIAGRQSVGGVVLSITLAAQVNQQMTAAVSLFHELQRAAKTLADMDWVASVVAERAPQIGATPPPDVIREGITFEEVSFSYPGSTGAVLEDVSFRLEPGSTVVIVGENGAGKSTLVKLLCGFYRARAGVIRIGETDLRDLSINAWRTRIAACFQDFARLEFSLREAVGAGQLADIGSDDAVLKALQRAHAETLVERMPRGLATPLGASNSNGTELSTGQWQKVAVARAMMRRAPLLMLLDEPTAALDAEAEHSLFEHYTASAKYVAERTGAITVMVSHRFATAKMADQILVLADRRVREAGTHAELMKQGGLYAELYSLQARAYR